MVLIRITKCTTSLWCWFWVEITLATFWSTYRLFNIYFFRCFSGHTFYSFKCLLYLWKICLCNIFLFGIENIYRSSFVDIWFLWKCFFSVTRFLKHASSLSLGTLNNLCIFQLYLWSNTFWYNGIWTKYPINNGFIHLAFLTSAKIRKTILWICIKLFNVLLSESRSQL